VEKVKAVAVTAPMVAVAETEKALEAAAVPRSFVVA
jgi:hypothetical protein